MTKPRSTLSALGEAELLDLAGGERDELVVVHVPQVVALEAEVLEADGRLARVGHHPRAPRAEVLDAADAHAGLVDVDPVVGEQVLAVDHQRDGQEVAVAQAARGVLDRLGGAPGSVMPTVRRSGSDEMTSEHSMRSPPARTATTRPSVGVELRDRRVHPHLAAGGDDLVGHRLPHLARAEARVVELGDQRLDLVAAVAEEGGLGGGEERQALDALGGPLGAQLGARHAPHLLRVGLEEQRVEALAEAVGDPGLEVLLVALGLEQRAQVGAGRRASARSGRAS